MRVTIEYKSYWNGKLPPEDTELFSWETTVSGPGFVTVYHSPAKPTARQVRAYIKQAKQSKYGMPDMIMHDGRIIDFKTTSTSTGRYAKQQDLYKALLQ